MGEKSTVQVRVRVYARSDIPKAGKGVKKGRIERKKHKKGWAPGGGDPLLTHCSSLREGDFNFFSVWEKGPTQYKSREEEGRVTPRQRWRRGKNRSRLLQGKKSEGLSRSGDLFEKGMGGDSRVCKHLRLEMKKKKRTLNQYYEKEDPKDEKRINTIIGGKMKSSIEGALGNGK